MQKNEILLGDCLEVMRGMADKSVDLVLTDPPYGIGAGDGCIASVGSKKWAPRRQFATKTWDAEIPPADYFLEMQRVAKHCIIFGGNYFAHLLPPSRCWLVWDKLNGATSFADCELAWTNLPGSVRKFEYLWNGLATQQASDKQDRVHPAQKPVGLFQAILERYAAPGALVLDPFSGSGTTAVACHNLGLDFLCIEKDPDYHAASVARLAKHRAQGLLPLAAAPVAQQAELCLGE